jgi:hypothetical protein
MKTQRFHISREYLTIAKFLMVETLTSKMISIMIYIEEVILKLFASVCTTKIHIVVSYLWLSLSQTTFHSMIAGSPIVKYVVSSMVSWISARRSLSTKESSIVFFKPEYLRK